MLHVVAEMENSNVVQWKMGINKLTENNNKGMSEYSPEMCQGTENRILNNPFATNIQPDQRFYPYQ